jgi:putative membrane protein
MEMKKNNPVPEKTRQTPLAILLLVVKFGRNLFRQLWPVLLILVLNPKRSTELQFLLFLAVLSFFSLVASVVSYFRFYYYLTDEDMHLEQGVIRKKKLQIPFERIQSVKIEQSLIHQAFNIVQLDIETAGSKDHELSITALHKSQAEEIKAFIFRKKEALSGKMTGTSDSPQNLEVDEQLFQLGFLDMFKIGISQNHIRTLGIIFVFILGLFNRITEVLDPNIEDFIVDQVDTGSIWNVGGWLLLILPFALGMSMILSIVRTSLQHADFTAFRTKEGIRLISGLFTRIERVAIRKKIQLLALETNPIKRLLGLVKVNIYQASSQEIQVNQSIQIPGCSPQQSIPVIQEYINPEIIHTAIFNRVDPKYRLRTFLLLGCIPLVGLIGFAYMRFGIEALWLACFLPVIALVVHYYYQRLVFAVSGDWLIKKEGLFSRKTTFLKLYKIQAVEISRSFYQLRHGLASIVIHTAARPVVIPFLPLQQAQQLADFLLARVEQSHMHWM